MIDAAASLLRLALGLGAVFLLGRGWLAALAPGSRFSGPERAALSFGLGVVPLTLWMLALDSLGLKFTILIILGPLAILTAAALLLRKIRDRGLGEGDPGPPAPPMPDSLTSYGFWDWVFLGLLALVLLFTALRAGLYPIWAWDAIATWGCKAKVFYESRSMDLTCIEAHNYYPNLVPLLLSYLYLCLGQANDHLVNLVHPLWGGLLLALLYGFLRRMGLTRRQALGTTCFFALNGTIFIVHLYIAYADVALAFFALGAAGFLYLWLVGRAPLGSLLLAAVFCAGMAWCKYEGPPLAATVLLAAALTLAALRPPGAWRRLLQLAWPLAGLAAGYLPWRLFAALRGLEMGADHIMGFYPRQLLEAVYYLGAALVQPFYFGFLWPALVLVLICTGRRVLATPSLFLALFLGGNLAAILLAYAVAPTSAAEFPAYVVATLDRLVLHLTPVAALLLGWGVKEFGDGGPLRKNEKAKKSPDFFPG